MTNVVTDFVKKLNANAPLNSGKANDSELSGYKYPYKPILVLSVLQSCPVGALFNTDIDIASNDKILKQYYDLLMSEEVLANFLIKHKSKDQWHLGFDHDLKQSIIKNIFDMPASKLADQNSSFWVYDNKLKTIRMNYKFDHDMDANKLKNMLIEACIKCLWDCIPGYKNLSLNEINTYAYIEQDLMLDECETFTPVMVRKYQHAFRKQVLDRDLKCKICCLETPEILEACHIKPHATCKNGFEKYTKDNGITLCSNHHKLFDAGMFSFDDTWKVIISSKFNYAEADLIIKRYEPCYIQLSNEKVYSNVYVQFHREHVLVQ